MKIGYRKPSFKKSIKAKTTGKYKRQLKKTVNPLYGQKGMGLVKDPKKSVYNRVYNKTTIDPFKSTNSTSKEANYDNLTDQEKAKIIEQKAYIKTTKAVNKINSKIGKTILSILSFMMAGMLFLLTMAIDSPDRYIALAIAVLLLVMGLKTLKSSR